MTSGDDIFKEPHCKLCGKRVHVKKWMLCEYHYAAHRKAGTLEETASQELASEFIDTIPAMPVQSQQPKAADLFEGEDAALLKASDAQFVYGEFDETKHSRWEWDFIRQRLEMLAKFFESPSSAGFAHRLIQYELDSEKTRRQMMIISDMLASTILKDDDAEEGAAGHTSREIANFERQEERLSKRLERIGKAIRQEQKDLQFLPEQTAEDVEKEIILAKLHERYREEKGRLVAGFDQEEMDLMEKKEMNVGLELERIQVITGRLSLERAKALAAVLVNCFIDFMGDEMELSDEAINIYMKQLREKLKSLAPHMVRLID
jgi:hypothetical protein